MSLLGKLPRRLGLWETEVVSAAVHIPWTQTCKLADRRVWPRNKFQVFVSVHDSHYIYICCAYIQPWTPRVFL